MGKKAVEMGRYGASELMRNKNLQKKAVNYGINKLTPFIQDSVGTAMDELSTKVRPNKKYKTDRKDLDGRSRSGVGGGVNPTLQYAFDEAKNGGYKGNIDQFAKTTGLTHELTGGNLVFDAVKFGWDKVAKPAVMKSIEADKKRKKFVDSGKRQHFVNSWEAVKELGYKHKYFTFYLSLTNKPLGWTMGGALARRKPTLTDKIAEGAAMFVNPTASWPAAFMKLGSQGLKGITDNIHHYRGGGWTLPGHKYTGPYNDLENQVRYDPKTGEILEIYDQPTGPTDAVAMQHDVDYSVCGDDRKCKNKADRKMVKSLDAIPWKERQWGHTLARTIINTKQKLGMGTKNVKRR